LVSVSERAKPVDRSYSAKEVERYREKMSENVQVAVDLEQAFGLRLREVAKTRVAHIVEEDGKLFWEAVKERELNSAHGVTKAGRARKTPCRPEFESRIRSLISGKEAQDFLCLVRYNTLKSAYYRAGVEHGSHGFRHTYAREMLMREFKNRGIYEQGRSMLQRILENRDAGYRKDHLVRKDERELYKQVCASIDRVHGWLGHGRGRIDLCEVYMKGV
jgi:integrase